MGAAIRLLGRRARPALHVLGFFAVCACSGKVLEQQPDGGHGSGGAPGATDGASTVSAGGSGGRAENQGGAMSGGGDRGGVAGGAADRCSAIAMEAWDTISKAIDTATAESNCLTDRDCAAVPVDSDCNFACAPVVTSQSGEKVIVAALLAANDGACKSFAAAGCSVAVHPCPFSGNSAACLGGACVSFLPEAWESVTVEKQNGAFASISTRPSCSTGQSCTLWKLTPDGALLKTVSGRPQSVEMSPSDAAAVDAIIRSVAFRQVFSPSQVVGPPLTCDPAPQGVTVSIDLMNASIESGADLTGCALAGPSGNPVQKLFDVVSVY